MNDRNLPSRVVPEQAEVTQAPAPVTHIHPLIHTHAEMTLKEWDNYRAEERAKLYYMDTAEKDRYFTDSISTFPTVDRLREIEDLGKRVAHEYAFLHFLWHLRVPSFIRSAIKRLLVRWR